MQLDFSVGRSTPQPQHDLPSQACRVFRARDIFVRSGVNRGDPLTQPDEICIGDRYLLDEQARSLRLSLQWGGAAQTLAPDSDLGQAGERLQLLARYTMLTDEGEKVDLLLLHLKESAESLFLPLSPIGARISYTLIDVERNPRAERLADLLCIAFAQGTRIALGDGNLCPVGDLEPGMKVLTRDHGPQPLRWLGKTTMRAVGSAAPVVITAGAIGNEEDLIISQHHRIFLYRRRPPNGVNTSEMLIQAKHLVDDSRIYIREGGYVDYFSLIFDRHEIIYAEGVSAESLLVTETTLSHLPPEMAEEVATLFPGLSHSQHFGTEAGREFMDGINLDILHPHAPPTDNA